MKQFSENIHVKIICEMLMGKEFTEDIKEGIANMWSILNNNSIQSFREIISYVIANSMGNPHFIHILCYFPKYLLTDIGISDMVPVLVEIIYKQLVTNLSY